MKRGLFATVLLVFCAGALIRVGHSQMAPAPTVDRVGFPAGYQTTFKKLFEFDRPAGFTVRIIWGNDAAASVTNFGNQFFYPYGSIFIMESWSTKRDSQMNPLLDENGRFQKDTLGTIFVMRKEPGFGSDYKENRNGEWEYVAYRADGTYVNAPNTTASCAICHLEAGQWKDWVFRSTLFQKKASGALPDAVMQNYTFVPGTIRIKAGSTLTMYNDDEVKHTFVANNGSFESGDMLAGESFSVKFNEPGQIEFRCTLHPNNMRGTIIVEK